MAKSTGGFSKTEAKKLVGSLNSELEVFERAIGQLKEDLFVLQRGDGDNSYWSGERAYVWTNAAINHEANDEKLLQHLDNCVKYFELLVRGGMQL